MSLFYFIKVFSRQKAHFRAKATGVGVENLPSAIGWQTKRRPAISRRCLSLVHDAILDFVNILYAKKGTHSM